MYNIIKNIYYSIYKIYNMLIYHETIIETIFIHIIVKIKTINSHILASYAIKSIKLELGLNSNFVNDIRKKYNNTSISMIFTISFKSYDGWKADEVSIYRDDFDSIESINYNKLRDILIFELDDVIERYNIEYIEYFNIKII
jgi:hypothetical protein